MSDSVSIIVILIYLFVGTCTVEFDDPNDLRMFKVVIKPDEGYWKNGRFSFKITIPPEYNNKVSIALFIYIDKMDRCTIKIDV